MKCKSRIFFVYSFVVLALISCSSQDNEESLNTKMKNNIQNIVNNKPRYDKEPYILLEKLHSIKTIDDKYQIAYVSSMDSDDKNNIYVNNAAFTGINPYLGCSLSLLLK